jgi:hypothetical protein
MKREGRERERERERGESGRKMGKCNRDEKRIERDQ